MDGVGVAGGGPGKGSTSAMTNRADSGRAGAEGLCWYSARTYPTQRPAVVQAENPVTELNPLSYRRPKSLMSVWPKVKPLVRGSPEISVKRVYIDSSRARKGAPVLASSRSSLNSD